MFTVKVSRSWEVLNCCGYPEIDFFFYRNQENCTNIIFCLRSLVPVFVLLCAEILKDFISNNGSLLFQTFQMKEMYVSFHFVGPAFENYNVI